MSDTHSETTTGGTDALSPETIDELRQALSGPLVTPKSPDYDETRSIWNGMIDRRPTVIARCRNADDVIHAVNFARDQGLAVSVRGGGHNIAGNAVCDDGMMIDLSLMKGVEVDAERLIARVEGGSTLADVDGATQARGLATPVGINSTTGIAGLTLGGGFGWLSRKFGLTIDNLLGVDIVTASGQLLHASETENADLFWGIRGGGGNFGVVTSFEFRLHHVGPIVLAGLIIHPLEAAAETLRFYRDFMKTAPEEFSCWFVMRKAPPAPFVPEEWHGREILGLAVCYCGSVEDGERVAQPLRDFGNPVVDIIGPMPFIAWQQALDAGQAPGLRNYWKSHDFLELSDGLIDTMIEHVWKLPDPHSEVAFAALGGAVSRVPVEATAYTHREPTYSINVHGRWEDPAKDAECIAWARGLLDATAPFATGGVYVNFMTGEEGDRVKMAYGVNYDRLVALKNTYDPKNLFRMNQNIRPTT